MRKEDLKQIDGNIDTFQSRQQSSTNFLTPQQFQSPIRPFERSAALIPQSDFIQKMIPTTHTMIMSNRQTLSANSAFNSSELQNKSNLAAPQAPNRPIVLNSPRSGQQAQSVSVESQLWNSWLRVEDCMQQSVKDGEIEIALRRMQSELEATVIRTDHLKAILRLKLEPHVDKSTSILINIIGNGHRRSGNSENFVTTSATTAARSTKSEKDEAATLNKFRVLMKRKYGIEISASSTNGSAIGKWGTESQSVSPLKKKEII